MYVRNCIRCPFNHNLGEVLAVAVSASVSVSLSVFGINGENKHYRLSEAPAGNPSGL